MSKIKDREKSYDVEIFSEEDSRSVINLLPDWVKSQAKIHIKKYAHMFTKDEHELLSWLRKNNATPNPTDGRLRMKFWMEYDSVMEQNLKEINIRNVYA